MDKHRFAVCARLCALDPWGAAHDARFDARRSNHRGGAARGRFHRGQGITTPSASTAAAGRCASRRPCRASRPGTAARRPARASDGRPWDLNLLVELQRHVTLTAIFAINEAGQVGATAGAAELRFDAVRIEVPAGYGGRPTHLNSGPQPASNARAFAVRRSAQELHEIDAQRPNMISAGGPRDQRRRRRGRLRGRRPEHHGLDRAARRLPGGLPGRFPRSR